VPSLPAELAEVVHTALEREPDRRHPTMQAFLAALLDYAEKPDPGVVTRHARSFPPPPMPGAEGLAPSTTATPVIPVRIPPEDADTEPGGDDPGSAERDSLPARSLPEWGRPMAAPEVGWYETRPSARAPRNAEWYAAAAGEALRV